MPDGKKSLAAKLAEVMAVVKRVEKRGKNEFHGYKYVTEADLADAIRDELSQRGVILVPDVQSIEVTPGTPTKAGRPQFLTTLMVKWTFKDGESAEEISFQIPGWGIDGEDKGGYKALTGSEKYALMKFFLVPTGDDPERDEQQQGTQGRSGASQPRTRPVAPSAPQQRPTEPSSPTAAPSVQHPAAEIMDNEIACTVYLVSKNETLAKNGKGGGVPYLAVNYWDGTVSKAMLCFDKQLFGQITLGAQEKRYIFKFKEAAKANQKPTITQVVSDGSEPKGVALDGNDEIPF